MELLLFYLLLPVFGYLFLAVLVGIVARGRGRSGFGWFVLAVIITPLIAFILVSSLPIIRRVSLPANIPSSFLNQTKICPRCAEAVKQGASVCRFCGFNFEEQDKHIQTSA
jgi:hypothetical protein